MDTYVRLYGEQHKGNDDNPTIGLVLCSEKSKAVVKYSVLADQQQLFTAKFLPYLPSEEGLKRELERELARAGNSWGGHRRGLSDQVQKTIYRHLPA